jgi:nucleoside-diphosphate-sugar epimerase
MPWQEHLMTFSKTIVITGATGLLGSHITKKLITKNYQVLALKRSSSNLDRLQDIPDKILFFDIANNNIEEIFQKYSPDAVIHCATNAGRKSQNIDDMVNTNLRLPLKLLQACADSKKTIFINTDTILDKRVNAYALTKRQFAEWLEFFSSSFPCINVALEIFYGPNDDSSKFCTKIIHDLLSKKSSIDLTSGEQKRGFIYVEDVADAFILLLEHGLSLSNGLYHFEVGAQENIKLKNFVLLLKKLTNNTSTQLNFGALNYRQHETMKYSPNLDPLIKLGWKQKYDLTQGLSKTIAAEQIKHKINKKYNN